MHEMSAPREFWSWATRNVDFGTFTVVDVGCSGGISDAWRSLGTRLRAACYDASEDEIRRLTSVETNRGIHYFAGYVGAPPDHPFVLQKGDKPDVADNPWRRLSVHRAQELAASARERRAPAPPAYDHLPEAPVSSKYSVPSADQLIVLPIHLIENGFDDIDFLKIDVDGKELEILHSLEGEIDRLGVTVVSVEVNFFGLADETNNTFHNIDRLMRGFGFDLFDLSFWRYSVDALPGRFIWGAPAATDFGRILQGDALYVRDLGNQRNAAFVDRMSAAKLFRLAMSLSLFKLPDCAAELIRQRESAFRELANPEEALDALVLESLGPTAGGYSGHIEAFARHWRATGSV